MESMNRPKTTSIAITALAVLLISALGWVYVERNAAAKAESDRRSEKLHAEELLSERLQVEKELEKVRMEISMLEKENLTLSRSIKEATSTSSGLENALTKLQRENAANKRKYAELTSAKSALEGQLADLNSSILDWQTKDREQLNTIADLQQMNQNLKEELGRAHLAYYDNPLIEPLRGSKDKLITKASRTQKLRVNVMIPSGLKEIQFKIVDPKGAILSSPDDGTLAVRTVDQGMHALTSTENQALPAYKQVEMIYLPKRKLKSGIYQIEVMSENLAVGSLQLRLR